MAKHARVLRRTNAAHGALPIVRRHLARLEECLRGLPTDRIADAAARLWDIAAAGGQIFVAGNGGSAATASHLALDLSKSTLGRDPGQAPLRVRAIALNDPGPVITAWANDHGYDRVFAEQIVTHARPGDAAVFCSVSGNSPNIVAAARAARSIGMVVIGLLGRPGGLMRELADFAIVVPSEDYQIVEDVHLAISHMLTRWLMTAIQSTTAAGSGLHAVGQRRAARATRHQGNARKRMA
jgi:D-sedoheptulose 7-phosphate isomerase